MKIQDEVAQIISLGALQSKILIQNAVRERMKKKPYPSTFIFAGNDFYWKNKAGEMTYHFRGCEDINAACGTYLAAYGAIGWRIKRKGDELFETEYW